MDSRIPTWKGETSKAHARRLREGWYEKYAPDQLSGIDLGCQHDPLNHTFRRWDIIFGDGDAMLMDGVPDDTFHTVYASHLLEHMVDPVTAVRNWYRILKPGGHLIICVPHRDLYEKQTSLPSRWNHDHKSLWLPDGPQEGDTRTVKATVLAAIPDANIVSLRVLDEGYEAGEPHDHAFGEYSIEAIVKK